MKRKETRRKHQLDWLARTFSLFPLINSCSTLFYILDKWSMPILRPQIINNKVERKKDKSNKLDVMCAKQWRYLFFFIQIFIDCESLIERMWRRSHSPGKMAPFVGPSCLMSKITGIVCRFFIFVNFLLVVVAFTILNPMQHRRPLFQCNNNNNNKRSLQW